MNFILTLIVLFGFSFTQFNWEDDGLAVRQGVHIEWQRTADLDNSNEFIFAWSDTRQGGRDIYIQKINENGEKIWGENGLTVVQEIGRQEDPILIADGQGGAYIVWVDYKNEPDDGDIYAQHVNSGGELSWELGGIGLATQPGKQVSPNMCSDGQGGAYVIWKDLTVSSYGHIYGTHLTTSGAISAGIGMPILSNESYHNNVSIEKAGLGHAILVWSDNIISDNADIRAQRINQSCETLWSEPFEGGISLCSETGNQLYPKVTYYDEDFSIVVWEDHRNSNEFGDIFYQFLDVEGNEVLSSQGVPACTNEANQIKPRVKAAPGAAFIIWEDFRNSNSDIFSQKVDHLNNIFWENDGRSIVSESGIQDQCRLTTDGLGGVFYIWLDERLAPYPETDVYIQHIDSNDNVSFPENGLSICNEDYYQFGPIIRGFNGKAIALWGDRRSGSIGLFSQLIDSNLNSLLFEDQGKEMFFGIDGNGQSPNLTYLNNEALISWDDRRFSPFQNLTYGLKLNDDTSLLNSQNGVALSENPYQSNSSIIFTGDNLFMGFGQTDGDINQYYTVLDNDLNTLDSFSPVDANNQASQEYYEIIYNSSEDLVYYVYSDNRDFANNIYVMQYSSNGAPTWSFPIKIVETLTDGFIPSDDNVIGGLSIDVQDGGGIVVLYNSGNFLGTKANAIRIDSNGQLSQGWQDNGNRLCTSESDQYIEDFDMISEGILVTFKDNRSGSNDIYSQLISISGQLLFDDSGLIISNEINDQQSSSLDVNSNELALICWEDFRLGTEYDIFCKTLDVISTSPSVDVWEISDEIELATASNTSGGNQTNPYVFSNDVTFLIAWEDSRNGVYTDVYFQELFNYQNLLSDGGVLLCGADFDQLNPKVGLMYEGNSNAQSEYLIYWDDLRSSGKEFLNNIFAQSYSSYLDPLSNDTYHHPEAFSISATYPNPFNPSLKVEFSLEVTTNIKIAVYDSKGREVDVLFNGVKNSGLHKVDWSPGIEVSSGIYFVKLIDKKNSLSKYEKITFLK